MYIDFYDEKEVNKYRVNLAEVNVNYTTTRDVGYGRITISGQERVKIDSLGGDLVDIFNIKSLDFSDSSKIYTYHNKDKSLWLTMQQYPQGNVHNTFTGKVITSNQTYEPVIAYDSYSIRINLYAFSVSNSYLMTGTYNLFLGDSMSLTLPQAPQEKFNYAPNGMSLGISIGVYPITYKERTVYCYGFIDTNSYKPAMVFSGSTAFGDTDISQTKPTGVILVKAGQILKVQMTAGAYAQKTETTEGKVWDNYDNTFVIYGLGLVPTTEYLLAHNLLANMYGIYREDLPNAGKPDSIEPNPDYPGDDDPEDNDPSEPSGGDGDKDKESDPVDDTDTVQTFDPTGLLTIYKLAQGQLNPLGQKLWSENFQNGILKITQNPIDAVIELKAFYFNIPSNTTKNLMLGNFDTEIVANTVQDTIVEVNFENLAISEFYGDFKDYNPFTKISIYLPFIGTQDLNVNDVMNSVINLTYHIDILSNNCVALITVSKNIDGTHLESVLYQFEGNCAQNIPISSASANTIIASRLSQFGAVNNAIRQVGSTMLNPIMGTGQQLLNSGTSIVNAGIEMERAEIGANHLDVARTGSLKGSAGILGTLTPYIIIERCISDYPTSFNRVMGVTSHRTLAVNTCEGYTKFSKIFISNFTGTRNEYDELINILQTGVIF